MLIQTDTVLSDGLSIPTASFGALIVASIPAWASDAGMINLPPSGAGVYADSHGVVTALTPEITASLAAAIKAHPVYVAERDRVAAAAAAGLKDRLRMQAANKRRGLIATGQIAIGQGRSWIDDDTAAAIGRTIQAVDLGFATVPVAWKLATGFVQMSRADLLALGSAVAEAQQEAFAAEAAIDAAIDAGAITTIAQIATYSWPPQIIIVRPAVV